MSSGICKNLCSLETGSFNRRTEAGCKNQNLNSPCLSERHGVRGTFLSQPVHEQIWCLLCAGAGGFLKGAMKLLARATITKHHRLDGLNTEMYFLTVLEARRLRTRASAGLGSCETSLPGLHTATFSPCPHGVFLLCLCPKLLFL